MTDNVFRILGLKQPEPEPEPTPNVFETLARSIVEFLPDGVTVGQALDELLKLPLSDAVDDIFGSVAES